MATEEERSKSSSDDDEVEQFQFKVVILGDGAVGKTSLAARFATDDFNRSYKQTIGLDFFIKQVTLPGNTTVALQLWDIGGQSIGSSMVQSYVFGAHAVLLVYDITSVQSFEDLDDWNAVVEEAFASRAMKPYKAVVANKADLASMRAVGPGKHNELVARLQSATHFVSAKTGDNVPTAFQRIAADLAGISVSRSELDAYSKVVDAQVASSVAQPGAVPRSQTKRNKQNQSRCQSM